MCRRVDRKFATGLSRYARIITRISGGTMLSNLINNPAAMARKVNATISFVGVSQFAEVFESSIMSSFMCSRFRVEGNQTFLYLSMIVANHDCFYNHYNNVHASNFPCPVLPAGRLPNSLHG